MAVSAQLNQTLSVNESEATNFTQWNALNQALVLNAGSTPPASLVAGGQIPITGGAITIDLTSLAGYVSAGATLTFLGKAIRALIVANPSAMMVKVAPGVSNPYDWSGGTGTSIPLGAGQEQLTFCAAAAPAVGSGAKTLKLSDTSLSVTACTGTTGTTILTVGSTTALTTGKLLSISGATSGYAVLNGIWTITVINATTFSIPITAPGGALSGTVIADGVMDLQLLAG